MLVDVGRNECVGCGQSRHEGTSMLKYSGYNIANLNNPMGLAIMITEPTGFGD